MTRGAEVLVRGLAALAIDASAETRDRLLTFVALLAKWNRVYNLTAVREPDAMVVRHLLDSAALLPWLIERLPTETDVGKRVPPTSSVPSRDTADRQAAASSLVLDIGTGAGLPVLPLALLLPTCRFLSVESNGKKCRFQRQVMIELGITNVDVHEGRIEALACEADVVMARAFTAPDRFLALAADRCRAAGHAFVLLGHSEPMPDPLPAPWTLQRLQRLQVPGLPATRHLAICQLACNGLHSGA